MILTPIAAERLPAVLQEFRAALAEGTVERAVFERIVAPARVEAEPARHAEAVALAAAFGIPTLFEPPQAAFSWDGCAIRVADSEASVVIHEVAHYQLAAPARRPLPDFGLGAGPESGRRAEADAAQALFGVERDLEEGLSSLLGIAWEAEFGHPAIHAFLEQNWLEGGARPSNLAHFRKMVGWLRRDGYLDAAGRPSYAIRCIGDADFFA